MHAVLMQEIRPDWGQQSRIRLSGDQAHFLERRLGIIYYTIQIAPRSLQKNLKEDYKDFTERHYKEILQETKGRYRFAFFGDNGEDPHVLWRHDLDASVHRAVRLAEIEKDCGVCSTYFVRLHSEFYNLLEGAVYDRILRITRMGHRAGPSL